MYMVYYSKISVSGYFGTIFQQTKNSELDLDPPTHFHSQLGFLEVFYFSKPLTESVVT